MTSRKSIFVPDNYYHVYNRGVDRANIFFCRDNYLYCLRLITKYSRAYKIAVVAYCLMPNHYHLLLRQNSEISISKFISVTFNAYVQGVNRRLGRKGTLFEARAQHIHIDRDEYLLHLCRYIHLNPVKANLVFSPEHWEFSNYLEWIGKRNSTLKDAKFISTYFKRSEDYRKFVSDVETKDPKEIKIQRYVIE